MLTHFLKEPIMLRLIRYVLLGLDFIVGSILGLLIGLIRPFNPTNSRWCAWFYAVLGLRMIGIKVECIGFENYPTDEGFIVVGNHQSNWDLLVVGSTIPDRTVSLGKKSLKWVPLFGQLFWLAGNILIDRNNPAKALEAMEITKIALTEKKTHIWFFAEGTRNHGKNMLPFKKGAFVTAINAGVPIIRVCASSYLDGFSLDNLDNGTARVKVLPRIETKDLTMDDIGSLMKECHDSMSEEIRGLDALAKLDKKS